MSDRTGHTGALRQRGCGIQRASGVGPLAANPAFGGRERFDPIARKEIANIEESDRTIGQLGRCRVCRKSNEHARASHCQDGCDSTRISEPSAAHHPCPPGSPKSGITGTTTGGCPSRGGQTTTLEPVVGHRQCEPKQDKSTHARFSSTSSAGLTRLGAASIPRHGCRAVRKPKTSGLLRGSLADVPVGSANPL